MGGHFGVRVKLGILGTPRIHKDDFGNSGEGA